MGWVFGCLREGDSIGCCGLYVRVSISCIVGIEG